MQRARFRESQLLLALLLAAAVVRTIAWTRTTVLFDDGPIFVYMAEAIAQGDWPAVLRHPYHPLYPILIWLFAPLTGGDLEQAGALVSILAGTGAVAALYVFLRDAFDSRTALLGGLILALHPFAVEFSCDVQSDGLYLALLLAGICLLWRAIDTPRATTVLGAGAVSGLAYLVRPEGLGLTLLAGVAALLLMARRRWNATRAALWLATVVLGTALTAGPYVVAIHQETGLWSLTQKKSLSALFSLSAEESALSDESAATSAQPETALPVQKSLTLATHLGQWRQLPLADRLLPAYSELWKAAVSGIRVELIGLILIGIWTVRGRPGRRALFIVSFVGLYAAVLFALAMNSGYVSRRHALPPLLPLLGYAGLGAAWAGGILARAFQRLGGRSGPVREAAALGMAAALIAAVWLPRDLRSRRDERLAERLAAEWLHAQDPSPYAVGAGRLRVAYYAGADFVPLPRLSSSGGSAPPLLDYLRGLGVRYVIVDEAAVARNPRFRQAQTDGLRLMHRAEARGYSAVVFEVPSTALER